MSFVPTSTVLPRALWRPAMFFFALAQILLAFAPLAEAKRMGDSAAHVEEAGTSLHHAHNEADCAACTARLLLSSAAPGTRDRSVIGTVSSTAPGATSRALTSAVTADSRSRAPPAQRA